MPPPYSDNLMCKLDLLEGSGVVRIADINALEQIEQLVEQLLDVFLILLRA